MGRLLVSKRQDSPRMTVDLLTHSPLQIFGQDSAPPNQFLWTMKVPCLSKLKEIRWQSLRIQNRVKIFTRKQRSKYESSVEMAINYHGVFSVLTCCNRAWRRRRFRILRFSNFYCVETAYFAAICWRKTGNLIRKILQHELDRWTANDTWHKRWVAVLKRCVLLLFDRAFMRVKGRIFPLFSLRWN